VSKVVLSLGDRVKGWLVKLFMLGWLLGGVVVFVRIAGVYFRVKLLFIIFVLVIFIYRFPKKLLHSVLVFNLLL
jgi:hypothetical protein